MKRKTISPRRFYLSMAVLFLALPFLLLSVRDGDTALAVLAGAVPAAVLLGSLIPVRLFSLDRPLTALSLTLCAFSILAVAAGNAVEAVPQALRCAVGAVFLIPGALLARGIRPSAASACCFGLPGLCLAAAPKLLPSLSFPAAEISLVFLMITFAALLSMRVHLPALLLALAASGLLLAGDCPAAALILGAGFLLLLWACSARLAVTVLSVSAVCLLFLGAESLFPGLLSLTAAGESPFPFRPSLFGTETAGTGPADVGALLPMLACRYGLVPAGSLVLFYPMMMFRGVFLARASRIRFRGLLAMGITLLVSLTALGALASDLGLWHRPSVSMPFLSDRLPSQCVSFFLIGMLGGVSCLNDRDLEEDIRLSALGK